MGHQIYMQRCLELARNGLGSTSPNPLVGSVIVNNDVIIGEGWHHRAGEPHAEVNAIESVADKTLLKDSTLYVNLEPCSHHGRTPPCADLIVSCGIPRVVISNIDTHSAVAGKGIERMRTAGIEVLTGVLEKEGRWLNRRFFCYHEKARPYVILKWAQTKDGFMDRERSEGSTGINWITADETQSLVHMWRTQEDAIMIGNRTLVNDNPSLTARSFTGKDPVPVVLSSGNELPEHLNLPGNTNSIFITTNKQLKLPAASVVHVTKDQNHPETWLRILKEREVLSVIVEGGATLIRSFLEAELWDEIRVLTGTPEFQKGLGAPVLPDNSHHSVMFGQDTLNIYYK